MRKIVIIFLILLCTLVSWYSIKSRDNNCFEVVKVLSADDFYIDFNKNKVAEAEERAVLYDVLSKNSSLSTEDNARLGYLSKKFADSKLLHQKVCFTDSDNFSDLTMSDGKNYLSELSQNGYVLEETNKDKLQKNIDETKSMDLVSYNQLSHKFHKLNCKHAFSSQNIIVVLRSELPEKSTPCKYCYIEKKTGNSSYETTSLFQNSLKTKQKYPREYFEKYSPLYKDSVLEFYVTDYTKQYYPSQKCLTTASQALLREINSAQKSIDFAIYGIDKQPQITNALLNAQKRGVKIRWVFDVDKNGESIYKENFVLKNSLSNAKSDLMLANNGVDANGKKIRDSIMHNKFFIFDGKKVWTGSANISHTDLSGFNANSVVLINSSEIAKIYEKEFEKMYSGEFHQLKSPTQENKVVVGSSKISVYFSPQDKAVLKHLVPIVENAKNYVYVPVFVITHKDFVQSLINAKNRGVDVKIVVDATSAASKNSSVKVLREAGVKVKTENRAGKMHMKSIIIDDKFAIIGSMNFTKSGESYNDENMIIVENPILAKNFKNKFLYFYNDIPDKWLTKNPSAESFSSINSCFDGIDNDFDGKTDMDDDGCKFIKK